jgi:hypothetical protein
MGGASGRAAQRTALRFAAPLTLVGLLGALPRARAAGVDPASPLTLIVGPAPGFSPMARVDGQRRGQSAAPIPSHPRTLWRRTVRGGLDATPVAVDARGSVVAASFHTAEIVQFSADGTEMWRRPTGLAPSISGVVLLNDGTRMAVTGAGEAIGFSPTGALRFRAAVDLLERTSRIGLLPLEEGGVALAAGAEVIALDAEGHASFRVRLPERIQGPLLATRRGLVATTQTGTVYQIHPSFITSLGDLGGDPGEAGASTADGTRLLAVVDGQRVVGMNLANGVVETRWSLPDHSLLGPVGLGPDGALVASTTAGALLWLAEAGGPPTRAAADPRPMQPPDAGRTDVAAPDESPPPLSDTQGRIAWARAGGRLGIIAPDGAVKIVDEPICASPVALVSAGPRRLVVACRTGSMVMLGDEAAP